MEIAAKMNTFDGLPPVKEDFVQKANASTPTLHTTNQDALGIVKPEKDETAALGWKIVDEGPIESMKVLQQGDSVIIDFGTLW